MTTWARNPLTGNTHRLCMSLGLASVDGHTAIGVGFHVSRSGLALWVGPIIMVMVERVFTQVEIDAGVAGPAPRTAR